MGDARGSRMLLLQAHPGTRRQIPPPAGAACDRLEVAALRLALAGWGWFVWARPGFSRHPRLAAPATGLFSPPLLRGTRGGGGRFGAAGPISAPGVLAG